MPADDELFKAREDLKRLQNIQRTHNIDTTDVQQELEKAFQDKIQESTEELHKIIEKFEDKREKQFKEKKTHEVDKGERDVLDLWMRLFNQVSFCNEVMGQIMLHYTLGVQLNDKKIEQFTSPLDYRIFFTVIQESGSGKGTGMSFTVDIINRLFYVVGGQKIPINIHEIGSFTTASLLSSYSEEGKQTTMIKGELEEYDAIYSEEGKNLLHPSDWSQDLHEVLIKNMEPMGTPANVWDKRLRDYTKPTRTIMRAQTATLTRPLGKLREILATSGLFQRQLFLANILEDETRDEMDKKAALGLLGTEEDLKEFERQKDKLADILIQVQMHARSNEIVFPPELLQYLNNKLVTLREDAKKMSDETNKRIARTFVARHRDLALKLAHHSCVMRFSTTVEEQDIQYAFELIKKLYEKTKIWIETEIMKDWQEKRAEDDLIEKIKYVLPKNTSMKLNIFYEKLAISERITIDSAKRITEMYSCGEYPMLEIKADKIRRKT